MSTYRTTVTGNDIQLTLTRNDHTVSLSRTGGQGSKGDSVTDIRLDGAELICTITRPDGTTYEISAGSLDDEFLIDYMSDVTIDTPIEGDVMIYDATASQWKNHQLTTTKLLDVDNTNKEDGAVLLYDGATSKYKATKTIENRNTIIKGGSF